MPTQSIDLSAVTDATFGGSAVEQINLNGSGIWTMPPQGLTSFKKVKLGVVNSVTANGRASASNYEELPIGQALVGFIGSSDMTIPEVNTGNGYVVGLYKHTNSFIYLIASVGLKGVITSSTSFDGSSFGVVNPDAGIYSPFVYGDSSQVYNTVGFPNNEDFIVIGKFDSTGVVSDKYSGTVVQSYTATVNYVPVTATVSVTASWSGSTVTLVGALLSGDAGGVYSYGANANSRVTQIEDDFLTTNGGNFISSYVNRNLVVTPYSNQTNMINNFYMGYL